MPRITSEICVKAKHACFHLKVKRYHLNVTSVSEWRCVPLSEDCLRKGGVSLIWQRNEPRHANKLSSYDTTPNMNSARTENQRFGNVMNEEQVMEIILLMIFRV